MKSLTLVLTILLSFSALAEVQVIYPELEFTEMECTKEARRKKCKRINNTYTCKREYVFKNTDETVSHKEFKVTSDVSSDRRRLKKEVKETFYLEIDYFELRLPPLCQ